LANALASQERNDTTPQHSLSGKVTSPIEEEEQLEVEQEQQQQQQQTATAAASLRLLALAHFGWQNSRG